MYGLFLSQFLGIFCVKLELCIILINKHTAFCVQILFPDYSKPKPVTFKSTNKNIPTYVTE